MMPINAPPIIDLFGVPLWSIQLAISIAGLVIGSVIAAAGSLIAYRNAYGAAPIYLVTSWGIGTHKNEDPDKFLVLSMKIEFWNRRKYPITLQGCTATFPGLSVRHVYRYVNDNAKLMISPGGDSTLHMSFRVGDSVKLDPEAHYTFKLDFPFEKPKSRNIDSMTKLLFHYFDPASNKRKKLYGHHRYHFNPEDLADFLPENDMSPPSPDGLRTEI
ncbi:hypothetical protein GCM10007881_64080 [Mesorhizobium huakuii]|uniref:hypothetical protein n=1 Tax=Mesorhizobium huakuii TaxID=28104 RepID=UPI00235D9146|nr:hypothetical protein [Mesorhizobium huakuii]GLQ82885.1 hypothetical protein GCM10007881_64080 [Mesorhizobium huakuii]